MDKQFYVNVVNLTAGKMYSLPILYPDRVEACVCGQNYVRDRRQENHDDVFYRVLIAKDGKVAEPDYFTIVGDEDEDDEACPHSEQECCEDCPFYSECWEFDDEDNDEEPEHGESVYGNAEEPSSDSLAELLSVFNAIRPNY
jgi:hypothetical protein